MQKIIPGYACEDLNYVLTAMLAPMLTLQSVHESRRHKLFSCMKNKTW